MSAFARGIRGAEGALALVDRSKFSKQALDLFIFTQTKEQSERFSCSPVAGRGLPAGGGGDGPSGGGAGGASAGCPPRRSLVRRLSLSSPPFYSFVVGGGGAYLCVVSLARWVFDGSPQPKKEKKNFLIAYVMRPIVGLVDANSLRPKQTNLVWDVTVLGLFSKCCYVCPLVKHVVRSWWVWHITIRTFRL